MRIRGQILDDGKVWKLNEKNQVHSNMVLERGKGNQELDGSGCYRM